MKRIDKVMSLRTISSVREMQRVADGLRLQGKQIGVVPTMGFLHDGHLSLLKLAREKSEIVIVTIFVNPTQFGPDEDFKRYPRDLERDRRLAEAAGCDFLFVPEAGEMYSERYLTYVEVEKLSGILEGKSRPTHFRGVTTVVSKLFNITKPHIAVFGQKDAQQAVIIKRMVEDLNFDVEILLAPIVREPDGLAMSSRNTYLSAAERKDALVLREALDLAERVIRDGERAPEKITKRIEQLIASRENTHLDYVAILDSETLASASKLEKDRGVLVALAVWVGKTRLIDNTVILPRT